MGGQGYTESTESADITELTERTESIEITESTESTKIIDTPEITERAESIKIIDTTEITERAESIKIIDTTESTDTTKSIDTTKSPPRSSLTELPDEVQILILLELHSLKDLWSLAQTCKHFYRLYSTCDRVWCSRLIKDLYVDYAKCRASAFSSAFRRQEHLSPRLTYSRLYPFKWARPGIWWGDNWQFGNLVLSTYDYDHQRFRWHYCNCFVDDEAGYVRVISRPEVPDRNLYSDLEPEPYSDPEFSPDQFEWINNHTLVKSRDLRPRIDVDDFIFELDPATVDPRAPDINRVYDPVELVLSRVNQHHDHNHDNSLAWPPYCIPASERTFSILTQTDDTDLPDEEEPQEPRHPPFSGNLIRITLAELGYYTPSSDKPPYSGTLKGRHKNVKTYYRLDESLLYPTESQPYQGLWHCSRTDVPLVGSCVLILQSAEHPEKLQAINVTAGAEVPRAETHFRVNNLDETRKRPDKYISWRDKDVVSCEIQVAGISYKAPKYIPGELVLADNNCLILVQPEYDLYQDQGQDQGHDEASEPISEPSSAAKTTEASDLLDDTKCELIFFKRISYDPMQRSVQNRIRPSLPSLLSLM